MYAAARERPGARNEAEREIAIRSEVPTMMRMVNADDVDELAWSSPKGRFAGFGKQISEALGRKPASTDLNERHPFDVEIARIAPGGSPCPYHGHTAQWEFYLVVSGTGVVRHEHGRTAIRAGDAFLFKPGEAHQLINDGSGDLVLFVVADNPVSDYGYYPDSGKWMVGLPGARRLVRSEALDYYDGEE